MPQLFNPKYVFGDDIEVEATLSLKNQDSGLPAGLQSGGTTETATESFTLELFKQSLRRFPGGDWQVASRFPDRIQGKSMFFPWLTPEGGVASVRAPS